MPIELFSPPCSQTAVDDLKRRLGHIRWIDELEDTSVSNGTGLGFLRDICAYWREGFDWKTQVELMSTFSHHRIQLKRGGVHFLHHRGVGPAPMPLILTHGWPGSFLEMTKIIPRLTNPAAYGGDPADAFDVVVPSLPGFGYSDRPRESGMNAFRIAEMWTELMLELGYRRFAAQGGDLGAAVSTALGLKHAERIIGLHLNFVPGSYRPYLPEGQQLSPAEEVFLKDAATWAEENGAYAHMHRTRPQTAGYALNDSPGGLAAWILEKFGDWSDCGGDVYRRFTRDELLTGVTLYWMTETIASSFRLYAEGKGAPLAFGPGGFVRVPCAFARFPREILLPPRSWAERGYNVQRWTDMPSGGHFAAAEEPELLAKDIRAFFQGYR